MRFRWLGARREDLKEELHSHLQMAVRDRTERGESGESAR